jgi:hypothetical protein
MAQAGNLVLGNEFNPLYKGTEKRITGEFGGNPGPKT